MITGVSSDPAVSAGSVEASGVPAAVRREPLLAVDGLTIDFARGGWAYRVVHGIDLAVHPGETVGLVGESGCGKSVTALALLGLLGAGARTGGTAVFDGKPLLTIDDRTYDGIRGSRIGMIFQDPLGSLNPVRTIGYHLREALARHRGLTGRAAAAEAVDLLARVGIAEPAMRLRAHPHELSGGMNQRVMIALALAGRPRLLIADEPSTALDVTIQAQILRLLRSLREEMGLAVLLITHDLGIVAENADRVAVMYAGRLVEDGPVASVFQEPRHPYTRGLLGAVPRLDGPRGTLRGIAGSLPGPGDALQGCAFAPRCPVASDRCRAVEPLRLEATAGHGCACHHPLIGPAEP